MITNKIFSEWTSVVDLAKTRIVRFPSYIFLCGGRISNTKGPGFFSCRDIFCSYIENNCSSFRENVIKAEQVFKYFEHSDYQDLLCFERDIAELSVLTVLFSESPGSIAELGSFSVLNTIQERLLVVMHQDDTYSESFIWRGPVSYLKNIAKDNGKDDPITIYNWKKPKDDSALYQTKDFSDAEDLAETIEKIINDQPKKMSFKKEQLGHTMLLIICILKTVRIATIKEIRFLLNSFGIVKETINIKQILSLLKSLNLVVLMPYRNYEFYLDASNTDWLSWSYKTERPRLKDTEYWTSRFIKFYKENQSEKVRALRSYLKSTGQIGD